MVLLTRITHITQVTVPELYNTVAFNKAPEPDTGNPITTHYAARSV